MTKKDFELIAKTINKLCCELDGAQVRMIANKFSNVLCSTNPRFNAQRFYDACMEGID